MKGLVGCMLGAAMVTGSVFAADLKVGDKAPVFELAGTDGRSHELGDLTGTTVVLAWFPKAFTSG